MPKIATMWCQCLDIMNAKITHMLGAVADASYCFQDSCTRELPLPDHLQRLHTAKQLDDAMLPYAVLGLCAPALILGTVAWLQHGRSKLS